jgi:SAM-dependent methyltransferase
MSGRKGDPIDFAWPIPPQVSGPPRWSGCGFVVDGRHAPFLSYGGESTGWSEELTELHEATAGEDHPIDIASRQHAIGQLRRRLRVKSPVILEVGSASGFLLERLQSVFPEATVIGSDYSPRIVAALAERAPTIPVLQFNLLACPLPAGCINAAVLLNVLEHISDDCRALGEVHRVLKPGGIAVVEVPAGPHLYDVYDRHLMHHRRYSLADLKAKAVQAGFEIVTASHLGFLAYPAFYATKRKNQRLAFAGEEASRRFVSQQILKTKRSVLLRILFKLERLLGHAVSFPWGIRCVVTCRKAGT